MARRNLSTETQENTTSANATKKNMASNSKVASGKNQTPCIAHKILVWKPYGPLPKEVDVLPEDLRDRPALYGRGTMKGVALPSVREEKPHADKEDVNDFLVADEYDATMLSPPGSDDDEEVKDLLADANARTRAQKTEVRRKLKLPTHLGMSENSGSDSDPEIKAPGWNQPVQKHGRGKAKQDVEQSDAGDDVSEVTVAPPKKAAKPARGGKQPTARRTPAASSRVRYRSTATTPPASLPTPATTPSKKRKSRVDDNNNERNTKKKSAVDSNDAVLRCTMMSMLTRPGCDPRRRLPIPEITITDQKALERMTGTVGFGFADEDFEPRTDGKPIGWMDELELEELSDADNDGDKDGDADMDWE